MQQPGYSDEVAALPNAECLARGLVGRDDEGIK